MKMLVTKFSNGKYQNEGQLFDEVILDDNIKLMGEMIALQVLSNSIPFDFEVVKKLYNGLVKDLHHLMKLSEVCAELGLTHDSVKYRKMRIRQKYNQLALV